MARSQPKMMIVNEGQCTGRCTSVVQLSWKHPPFLSAAVCSSVPLPPRFRFWDWRSEFLGGVRPLRYSLGWTNFFPLHRPYVPSPLTARRMVLVRSVISRPCKNRRVREKERKHCSGGGPPNSSPSLPSFIGDLSNRSLPGSCSKCQQTSYHRWLLPLPFSLCFEKRMTPSVAGRETDGRNGRTPFRFSGNSDAWGGGGFRPI